MATIATIQNLLSREDCEKILQRTIDRPIQLLSYKIAKFHDEVAGFLGDHLSLTIKFISNNTPQKITYFLKTLPQFNTNQLNYVVESGIFRKEVILYHNLLAELLKIARFGPRCYFIKDNLLVLEDLKSKGFKMLPKHDYLNEANTLAMLKTLAKFHAATIVYEKKWGVKLDQKFKEEVKETCFSFVEGQPRQKWLVSSTNCVVKLMKLVPSKHNHEEIASKFKKFVFEELQEIISPSKRYRNVLTHDDLWCNNLLFNEDQECIFVDFQLVRYTPPALDFLTTLYLNLETFYVENNLERLKKIYYGFLVETLDSNHLGSSELPLSEFEESVSYYKLAALTETVMYGTHIFITEDLANEIMDDIDKYNEFSFINRSKFAIPEFQNKSQYRSRLSGPVTLLMEALNEFKSDAKNNQYQSCSDVND